MLRHFRDGLRRAPAVARLVAIAALLLVATSAHLGMRSGGTDPSWPALAVAGSALGVLSGAPRHLWPLPAIWLVATLLAASSAEPVRHPAFLLTALVGGGTALVAAIAADALPRLRGRRRSRT